jgi:hypothetical protein
MSAAHIAGALDREHLDAIDESVAGREERARLQAELERQAQAYISHKVDEDSPAGPGRRSCLRWGWAGGGKRQADLVDQAEP